MFTTKITPTPNLARPTATRYASVPPSGSARFDEEIGFPHSEIPGSKVAHTSPGLIAACHVLHRLCMPRHSPNALTSHLRVHITNTKTAPDTLSQEHPNSFSRWSTWFTSSQLDCTRPAFQTHPKPRTAFPCRKTAAQFAWPENRTSCKP